MEIVDTYIATAPPERRALLTRLDGLIRAVAPELDERVWEYSGSMIGYGTYHYRYASGREGDWFALGIADRKNYVALYSTAIADGEYVAEKHRADFAGQKVGKSCISIAKPELLVDSAVTDLVRATVIWLRDRS